MLRSSILTRILVVYGQTSPHLFFFLCVCLWNLSQNACTYIHDISSQKLLLWRHNARWVRQGQGYWTPIKLNLWLTGALCRHLNFCGLGFAGIVQCNAENQAVNGKEDVHEAKMRSELSAFCLGLMGPKENTDHIRYPKIINKEKKNDKYNMISDC